MSKLVPVRQFLKYGKYIPSILGMYKRQRRMTSRPAKRMRMTSRRRARSAPRRSLTAKRSKFTRWNRAKRSISNQRVVPYKSFRYAFLNTAKAGAVIEANCITDLPIASRSYNNVRIKSFDINLHVMPDTGCTRPTWIRFALVVQTGPYVLPTATNLIQGTSHSDNYITMSTANHGWQNRTYALNPNYKVIYAKTIKMAPLLESAATSVQSNLEAQCQIRARVKYPKFLQYDTTVDNVAVASNVFAIWWFDDDWRLAGYPSTTTHSFNGDIRTNYRVTEF